MLSAERDIGVVSSDQNLRAIAQGVSVFIHSGDHMGLFSAVADGADFPHFVGEGEKGGGAREEFSSEIDP